MTDLGLRLMMLFQDAEASFNWDEAMLALMITAMVMGGLAMMEWIRVAPQRRRRAASAPRPAAAAAPRAKAAASSSADAASEPVYLERAPLFSNMDWGRALLAGIVGTAVFSAVDYIAGALGATRLLVPENLALMLDANADFSVWGWVVHIIMGISIAIIYAGVFARTLLQDQPGIVRGLLYSMLPFLAAQLVVVPFMGGGYFFAEMGDAAGGLVLLSLIGHLLYGAVVGFIYEPIEYEEDSELAA